MRLSPTSVTADSARLSGGVLLTHFNSPVHSGELHLALIHLRWIYFLNNRLVGAKPVSLMSRKSVKNLGLCDTNLDVVTMNETWSIPTRSKLRGRTSGSY